MTVQAFDTTEARRFLERIFDRVPGFIEIRALAEDAPPNRTFHATVDDALRQISTLAERQQNIYVGVATRRTTANGTKRNLESASALWVDMDFWDEGDREALEVGLKGFPLPPSLRVCSGGGEHLYWSLDEPFPLDNPTNVDRFEAVLKGLCDVLGGDRDATDTSRILRIPGTMNYPDQRKR